MARAALWGEGPPGEEEQVAGTMMIKAWRYCLAGLALALLLAAFVHLLETPFWPDAVAKELSRLHFPP